MKSRLSVWILQSGPNATAASCRPTSAAPAIIMPVDAEPRQEPRHRHGVEQAADRKARDDDARDRKPGFAEFEQERRDEGKQAEHAAAFDEDGRVAELRAFGIAEDRAIALPERRQARPRRPRQRRAAEIRRPPRSRPASPPRRARPARRASRGNRRSGPTPRRPADCRSWRRPAFGPIATWRLSGPTRSLVRPSATGNTPPEPMPARMRVANSSGNEVASAPRMLARPSSTRQIDHQPRLAEHIGGGAEHRLNDGEGEGERRRETGGGRDADAEIVGDMRQHRIERTRRQAGRKGRQRNDVEGRRQCGWMRSRRRRRHWRAGSSPWPARRTPSASCSKASNSRSGTMLGPSDGA